MFSARFGLALVLFWLVVAWPAQAESLTDPTRPLAYEANRSASMQWTLSAVWMRGQRRLAVINGQRLTEGDVIKNSADTRIKRIEADAVLLERNGKTWRLRMAGESVRQRSTTEVHQ